MTCKDCIYYQRCVDEWLDVAKYTLSIFWEKKDVRQN